MDGLDRINAVMDYIEAHLNESVDFDDIARISLSPAGFFARMFAALMDMPLSEYIRRRRLTRAAFDLRTTGQRVIDIAARYGYESPDAFCAAFKRLHGVTPTAARKSGAALKSYPPIRFQLSVKGDAVMNYRIVTLPPIAVIGKNLITSNENDSQFTRIPEFWTQCNRDGTVEALCRVGAPSVLPEGLLGICMDARPDGTFRYVIGVENANGIREEAMESFDIPAGEWAVFECRGAMPQAIQTVWKRIFSEFLPASAYRHAGTPDMEVYPPGDGGSPDYRSEIWIPITAK